MSMVSKPPLTRRWTPYQAMRDVHRLQTSAHAEMDLKFVLLQDGSRANLRSRGDGPPFQTPRWHITSKPPLTRRWTYWTLHIPTFIVQTSAHAEMDPKFMGCRRCDAANLRSRGDGPAVIVQHSADHGKPPLTRRWTYRALPSGRARFQTSAHAEMDPILDNVGVAAGANLRSRGDGPMWLKATGIKEDKPPLTRRWTHHRQSVERRAAQTSAHAEMDLLSAMSARFVLPNLRSRGDGPG